MSYEVTEPGCSFLSYFCVFGILCDGVFLVYCRFMLSAPVQLIAWKECPQNDLLCIKRDIKQLLTHSLSLEVMIGYHYFT